MMHRYAMLLVLVLAAILAGCGSSNPNPDFSIAVPASIVLQSQGQAIGNLVISGKNGFHGSISLTVSGLPAFVAINLPTAVLAGGTYQVTAGTYQMTFADPSGGVPYETYNITFQATSGSLQHSSNMALQVMQ
jgi:hypothetical protein